jgi:DNA-directed RNA polymerase specialized sigma subunit|tara:strand:- start:1766 stop:2317 length:552 start_codon:yes stop_codon:yes gene_type:complete
MAVKINKKKTEHYVDNKVFLEEMKKYRKKVLSARKRKRKDPPINDYIGECFLKIANHLSYRPNFINYTYKEDMISDGIENCLTYVANFDPEKSNNPFAYFTQIIYYAFIRRIQKEKKQTTIKQKLILKSGLDEIVRQEGDNEEYQNSYADFLRKNMVVDVEPEKKEKPKLTKRKKLSKLEYFM